MSEAKFPAKDAVDFLIIGAGAAGGVIAKELATAGFRVVVLEQGPYLRERDYSHDEIKYTYQPGLTNDPKTQNMMAAAAVMTRPVRAKPSATAVALSPVRSHSSRMRESRNTS